MKNHDLKNKIQNFVTKLVIFFIALQITIFAFSSFAQPITNLATGKNLPDLSGLTWLKEDSFLAVHDSKSLDPNQPRVSLINLPQSSKGIEWQTLKIDWETVGGISMDL
jgi:hypothetical protein